MGCFRSAHGSPTVWVVKGTVRSRRLSGRARIVSVAEGREEGFEKICPGCAWTSTGREVIGEGSSRTSSIGPGTPQGRWKPRQFFRGCVLVVHEHRRCSNKHDVIVREHCKGTRDHSKFVRVGRRSLRVLRVLHRRHRMFSMDKDEILRSRRRVHRDESMLLRDDDRTSTRATVIFDRSSLYAKNESRSSRRP